MHPLLRQVHAAGASDAPHYLVHSRGLDRVFHALCTENVGLDGPGAVQDDLLLITRVMRCVSQPAGAARRGANVSATRQGQRWGRGGVPPPGAAAGVPTGISGPSACYIKPPCMKWTLLVG